MEINFMQILIIILIFLIFGTLIAIVNLKSKSKKPVNKEQLTWAKIENLNVKKKELIEQKKELTYRYTAKSVDENTYSKTIKKIEEEISKIEEEINKEISELTNEKNPENEENELRFKNLKIKGNLNELIVENKNLKEKISELESFIKSISKENNKNIEIEDVNKIKYYSLIIEKYKNIINENERKTISELKEMIKPTDLTIKSITSKFSPIAYNYNKDYLQTIKKIYNFVKSEINIVKNNLKIVFWIDFSKVFKEKIADEQTASVIICSCMQALQDNLSTIEVILLEDDIVHSIVTTKIKETYYLLDVSQNIPFDTYKGQDINKLYSEYRYNDKKIIKKIYSFNNLNYTDHNQK